jgi:DNA repair protein RadC
MQTITRLTIKDLPLDERPRERLYKNGPDALKTSELIAIIIRAGTHKKTALETAEDLLNKFSGNLSRLARATKRELSCGINGIGPAKAAQLMASFELGKRIAGFSEVEKPSINTPSDVARILMNEMRYYKKEVFKVLLLDTKNRLIKIETISSGILDASLVHPREVFYPAIQEMASSIILVHNHPSGNIIPSAQDIEITKNIIEAGKIMNIDVIDHIIIGEGKFLSLKEKKVI